MTAPDPSALRPRSALLSISMVATLAFRLVNAVRAHELVQEERTALDGSSGSVEGNARVVGGLVAWLYRFEMYVAIAHAAVSLILIVGIVRILSSADDEMGTIRLRRLLSGYFVVGALVAVAAVPVTFGFGAIAVVVPTTMGWWGFLHPIPAILIPVTVAALHRRGSHVGSRPAGDREDAPLPGRSASDLS